MCKISIIIPFHNSASSLARCVESVLNQSFKDFELILVDDGSTDGSAEISDDYARKDKRVIAIHKKNGGVSQARNAGLAAAKGEFVTFADSDDWLDPNTFEVYVNAATASNADIIRAGYYREIQSSGETSLVCADKDETFTSPCEYYRALEESQYYSYVWNVLVKRSVINGIQFREDLSWLEDHIFFYKVYPNCKKMALLKQPLYHYVIHESSSLSDVRNADDVWKSAQAELDGRLEVINGCDAQLEEEAWDRYRYMISKLVSLIYTQQYAYAERQRFSSFIPRTDQFFYRDEKLFFNRQMPFWIKDGVLRLIYFKRKHRMI